MESGQRRGGDEAKGYVSTERITGKSDGRISDDSSSWAISVRWNLVDKKGLTKEYISTRGFTGEAIGKDLLLPEKGIIYHFQKHYQDREGPHIEGFSFHHMEKKWSSIIQPMHGLHAKSDRHTQSVYLLINSFCFFDFPRLRLWLLVVSEREENAC